MLLTRKQQLLHASVTPALLELANTNTVRAIKELRTLTGAKLHDCAAVYEFAREHGIGVPVRVFVCMDSGGLWASGSNREVAEEILYAEHEDDVVPPLKFTAMLAYLLPPSPETDVVSPIIEPVEE